MLCLKFVNQSVWTGGKMVSNQKSWVKFSSMPLIGSSKSFMTHLGKICNELRRWLFTFGWLISGVIALYTASPDFEVTLKHRDQTCSSRNNARGVPTVSYFEAKGRWSSRCICGVGSENGREEGTWQIENQQPATKHTANTTRFFHRQSTSVPNCYLLGGCLYVMS